MNDRGFALPPPPPPPPPTRSGWRKFRGQPGWLQALAWVVGAPVVLALLALSKPKGQRRLWWVLTAIAAFVYVVAVTPRPSEPTTVASESPTSTTLAHPPTTREDVQPTTTTTIPDAPEDGATRSGDFSDEADPADADDDRFDRSSATSILLGKLDALVLEPEHARAGYERSLFPHWDDADSDGCDTRCEVLAAQRLPDGFWFSAWDGYSTDDPSELHVDHVVALAEAWDSGADAWTADRRDDFADSLINLLAVSAPSNLRKSDKDAAEWFPSRSEANCLWASTVVRVKSHWKLAVDKAEHEALANLLRTCGDFVPPTTTTAPPPPPTTIAPPPPRPPSSNCTPGYDPCIPDEGTDVDCEGGGADGPRYVEGPVYVTGSDPYDLDRDGNGVGCQS
jgi:hypothetical protein